MGKNTKIIIIVIVALLILFGIMKVFGGGGAFLGTLGSTTGSEESLASCTPGTFSGASERLTIDITVKEKVAGGCAITAGVSVAQGAGFFGAYDKNKDGNLTMDCVVPSTIGNFAQLTDYLKGPGLQGCSGEYKDMVNSVPTS